MAELEPSTVVARYAGRPCSAASTPRRAAPCGSSASAPAAPTLAARRAARPLPLPAKKGAAREKGRATGASMAANGHVGSDVAVHVGSQRWSEAFWTSSDTLE